jgi:hypothetical protein
VNIFLGGLTICCECDQPFPYVPIVTAEDLGQVPDGARMEWAGNLPHAEWEGDPLWGGDWWPDTCAKCDPNAWFFPVMSGASFFRS